MTDIIEGFVIGGTISLTVTNHGHAVGLALSSRIQLPIEATLTVEQSRRLRRLLSAAERRAA